MPRANRYYAPGCVWHITHRCHDRAFLLKFGRDRSRWIHWLGVARKRYGLAILDYCVTSNHVHLLVRDQGEGEIAQSMQLLQSRVAQEYNWRRKRDGAFWHDRYHATAVDSGVHALRCSTYIAMNMVRAGVVRHPSEWRWCGCREIVEGRQRYRLIDRHALAEALGIEGTELANIYRDRITYLLGQRDAIREPEWTESVAVGGEPFVESVKQALRDVRATWQVMADRHAGGEVCLKEEVSPYNTVLGGKSAPLSIIFRPFKDASR